MLNDGVAIMELPIGRPSKSVIGMGVYCGNMISYQKINTAMFTLGDNPYIFPVSVLIRQVK